MPPCQQIKISKTLADVKTVPPMMRWTLSVATPLARWNALKAAVNRNTVSNNFPPGGMDFNRLSMVASGPWL